MKTGSQESHSDIDASTDLAIIFGVVRLPKVTLDGIWNGKTGEHWQNEQTDVISRSPTLKPD